MLYKLFENVSGTFQVLLMREEGMFPFRPNRSMYAVVAPLKSTADVNIDEFDCIPNVDHALQYVQYLLIDRRIYLIMNYDLDT